MLYNPPTGGAANDPYVGKNVAAGTQGSKVPPAAIESTQREIVAVITASGQNPTNADWQQLLRSVRSGVLEAYVDTGAVNAPAIAPVPAHNTLVDGLHVRVRMKFAPTGPTNLAINVLLAPVQRVGGLALAGGEWAPNDIVDLVYNGGRSAFQITGLTKNDIASPVPASALWHLGVDSSNAAAHIVATVAPAVSTRGTNYAYLIVPAHDCAGVTDIDVGFGPTPLTRGDTTPLKALDYSAGQPLIIIDDGTQFRLSGVFAGQGLKKTGSSVALDFPDLSEQDAIAAGDAFAYYDISAAAHVKVPFSVLAAAILSGFATQPGSAALLNPQALHIEERRAQNVQPQHYTAAGTYTRQLNTIVSNQISGASLDLSGTATNGYITLPAGTYRLWYSSDTHQSGFTVNRVFDHTHNVELSRGTAVDSNVSQDSDSVTIPGNGCSRFTLTSASVISFDQRVFTPGSYGYSGDDSTGYDAFVDAWIHLEKENGQP